MEDEIRTYSIEAADLITNPKKLMNQIEPYELNGKTIKDCYESREGLVIEFTDGTRVVLAGDNRFHYYNGSIEIKKKYV